MLPTLPPFAELTLQFTFVSVKPFSVAANRKEPPAGAVADVGFMASPNPGEMVTTAVLDVIVVVVVEPVGVCVVMAVMSTSPLFVDGTVKGAVYTPTSLSVLDEMIVPIVAFPPLIPFTCQVTVVVVEVVPLLRLTTAVKSVCVLSGTVAVVGVIVTDVMVALLPPPQLTRIMSATATTTASEQCASFCQDTFSGSAARRGVRRREKSKRHALPDSGKTTLDIKC
jgi:hypothetical protein